MQPCLVVHCSVLVLWIALVLGGGAIAAAWNIQNMPSWHTARDAAGRPSSGRSNSIPTFHCSSVGSGKSVGPHCFVLSMAKPSSGNGRSDSSGSSNNNKVLWSLPNDFPMFLNQCAIQSFMFLLRSMRDPQTVLWLEEFTQPVFRSKRAIIQQALLDRQQTDSLPSSAAASTSSSDPSATAVAAFGSNSSSSSSNSSGDVKAVPLTSDTAPGSGLNARILLYHGLGIVNTTLFPTWDSYFRQLLDQPTTVFVIESSRPHIPDYELEINPASLCNRILSVREQIAREFARDLAVIANLGSQTLEAYWRAVKEQHKGGGGGGETVQPLQIDRPDLSFLDYDSSDNDDDGYAPSPLRKGNFDLLLLLTTQEAIHRILNTDARQQQQQQQQSSSSSSSSSNDFLYNFYTERLVTHFTGSVPYHRADDFLQELLSTPPRWMSTTTTSLIDPLHLAERIFTERAVVAQEWRDIARNAPNLHMDIKRLQLNKLMARYSSNNEEPTSYQ